MLCPELPALTDILISRGHTVEIETNGSIPIGKLADAKHRPFFTLDYKLPGSGMQKHMLTDNYRYLVQGDAVKFVSGSKKDLEAAEEIINKYKLCEKCAVFISPVFGKIEPVEIAGFITERKLNGVRLQLQLHKYIWDPDMKGV